MYFTAMVAFALAQPVLPSADPYGDMLRAALADLARVPEEDRHDTRYGVRPPLRRWAVYRKVVAFHTNSLSREADLIQVEDVPGQLVRINLKDFLWDRKVWERMASQERYFHVVTKGRQVQPRAVAPAAVPPQVQGGRVFVERDGFLQEVDRGEVRQGEDVFLRSRPGGPLVRQKLPQAPAAPAVQAQAVPQAAAAAEVAHAPWLPAKLIVELGLAVNSDVPIVRLDWFVWQTGAQAKRGGAGYYDFIGFKNRDEADKFVGLNREAAERSRKKLGAVVDENLDGPAPNNRQILLEGTLNGHVIRSLDVDGNDGEKNAIVNLDGKLAHKAEEIYYPHLNGMFYYVASDDKGVFQDKVPVQFASDSVHFGNKVEIEPMFSCVSCHIEGLRPIDDWMRKTYRGALEFKSGKGKLEDRRLTRIYLSDLDSEIKVSNDRYARTLKKVNGFTPEENAVAYREEWKAYDRTRLGLAETAAELYTDVPTWKAALKAYARNKVADPILNGLLNEPRANTMRRDHWVERYELAQEILRGAKP